MAEKEEKKIEKSKYAQTEEEILKFWKEQSVFEQSLDKKSPKGEFIFYEGPPTANGRPGIHHLLSRAFKDVVLRYKTMQGYNVKRRAGWDTHGLPVELEVEKILGLKSKKEIEEYGVAEFNQKCKENVWKYIGEWEKFTDRIGYWLDQDNAYVTYEPYYIESIWWILKEISEKDLLYKDYKVVPWCPRCGTALSSHELAQGYEDVKDISITAKFKIKGESNKFILAWTTTPWTLPGNIALAVGEDITYTELRIKNEESDEKQTYIIAKDRITDVFSDQEYEIVREIKGKDLVGLQYEPLFPFLNEKIKDEKNYDKAFKVYSADFVTTEDGTGIVHTAVMYGQDDFELGTEIGLPKVHLVGEDGKFLKGTGEFEGRFVKDEDLEVSIIKDLHGKNLLFKKQKYEHSYPHCWRCKTPLIYYARDSWYIKVSDLRDRLVKENEDINWEPNHIKEGRFGEWLREIKDWAISRERYWGTPLPVWETEDGEERMVIGSIDEINQNSQKSGNSYFVMRHGESQSNVSNIVSGSEKNPHSLTDKGKEEVKEAVEKLKKEKIDLIITSPLVRTRETADLVAEGLGMGKSSVENEGKVKEIQTGIYEGRPNSEYHEAYKTYENLYEESPEKGESLLDVKRRVAELMVDLEKKYKDKNILIVTHEYVSWMLSAVAEGLDKKGTINLKQKDDFIKTGEFRKIDFKNIPRNKDGELDLHKPYVDDFVLVSPKSGKEMRRVSEVIDVWFDSGAMPFAEDHYPFQNKEWIDKEGYPADYITEAIDQTRGWFYTLHAIGNLLGKGKAFKNVICLGHIMDKEGKKMSKSLGNTVDPWEAMDKYGADALRFWMYSINQPGESKNFDEKTVDEVVKKVFNLFTNVYSFYDLYADKDADYSDNSSNILDKWILVRMNSLANDVTRNLDNYKVLESARLIRDFIGDLSQWYLRRSRDRFKGENKKDRLDASGTLKNVIKNLCIIMAPFTPFISEDVYQKIRNEGEVKSVHLLSWPQTDVSSIGEVMIVPRMEEVRKLASEGLMLRSKEGIKVRQPLGSVTLKSESLKVEEEMLEILKDELNVKEVFFNPALDSEVVLDTEITPELEEEGDVRDFIRLVQDLRKEKTLTPDQKVTLLYKGSQEAKDFIKRNTESISKPLSVTQINESEGDLSKEASLSKFKINFDIEVI